MLTKIALRFGLFGLLIGLGLILFFLATAGDTDPNWPSYWMFKPLIITPLAGASAGFFSFWLRSKIFFFGNIHWLKTVLSIACSIPILWIGFILGLNGTYWN